MNILILYIFNPIFIGIGATLTVDLWSLFLKYVFKVVPSNTCLIGRWILYMPEGIFKHANLASAPQLRSECTLGWIAHYLIGILFAFAFLALACNNWLQHPTLLPAIFFGIITVLAPFLIMQPSFGLGVAASKVSNPVQARLRSLMSHIIFGIGLYIFGSLTS